MRKSLKMCSLMRMDDREYVTLDIDGNEMEGNESEEDAEDDAE